MRTAMILAALGVFVAPACDEPAASLVEYRMSWVQADCAPWDGPALTVYLTDSPADSAKYEAAHLSVSVWRGVVGLEGGRIDLAKDGAASRCAASGDCTPATAGWIRFDHVDPDVHVAGRFLIQFAGSTVQGSFDAQWLRRTVLCG